MPKHKQTKDKFENDYFYLPFNYCSVSLRPLNTCKNICSGREGNLYNKFYLLEHAIKYHKNPTTGKKCLSLKDIISLNIALDKNGKFICPVNIKVLNKSLKIVLISET